MYRMNPAKDDTPTAPPTPTETSPIYESNEGYRKLRMQNLYRY